MVATLRPKGAPPPVYGDRRDEFTLEIHHGGFFVGSGNLRSYVDERVSWFDSIEADTWSPLWFPDFAEQLGYQHNLNLKIHWLLPGKTLVDGLRLILSDTDTNVMARCAQDVKNLVVYFDHEDLYDEVNWDDVVTNPVSDLPKVISPCKVQYAEKNPTEKLPIFYTNLENIRVDQAVDNETESGCEDDGLWDSDNEIEEGDEDLFEDLVSSHVSVVKDNKKAKGSKLKILAISRPVQGSDEEDTDDDGLDLPESDGEGDVRLRFTSFSEEDMHNPTFHVGLVFPTVQKGSQSTSLSQPRGPLPDSAFICSNQPVARPTPLTTGTKAGRAATGRKKKPAGTSSKVGNEAPAKKSKTRKGAAANNS